MIRVYASGMERLGVEGDGFWEELKGFIERIE